MARDNRYVTNTGCSGAESLVISRFRCTTQERHPYSRREGPRRRRYRAGTVVDPYERTHSGTERKYSVRNRIRSENRVQPVGAAGDTIEKVSGVSVAFRGESPLATTATDRGSR